MCLEFLQSIAISSTHAVPVDFLDDLKVACHDLRASSERIMWKQKMKNPCRVFKMAKMYWKTGCSNRTTRMLEAQVKPSRKERKSTIRTICMFLELALALVRIFFPRERMEWIITTRTTKL